MNHYLPWTLLTLSAMVACLDKEAPTDSESLALGGHSNLDYVAGGQGDAAGTRSTQVSAGGNTSGGAATTGGGSVPGNTGGTKSSDSAAVGGNTSSIVFDPAMTAGCARWPQNRLAPWVGTFFFGPDPGPCSETRVDADGKVSVSTATYDAQGRITQMVEPTMTSHYVYVGERIEKVTVDGADWGFYEYAADSLKFTAGPPSIYAAIWQLDSLGYPRRLIVDYSWTGSSPDAIYRYEYENCRLVRRTVELAVDPKTTPEWQYSYDTAGHLVKVTASNGWNATEDYSCWK